MNSTLWIWTSSVHSNTVLYSLHYNSSSAHKWHTVTACLSASKKYFYFFISYLLNPLQSLAQYTFLTAAKFKLSSFTILYVVQLSVHSSLKTLRHSHHNDWVDPVWHKMHSVQSADDFRHFHFGTYSVSGKRDQNVSGLIDWVRFNLSLIHIWRCRRRG